MPRNSPRPQSSPPEDIFDLALREILSQDNAHAYSTFSCFQGYLWQFRLSTVVEPSDICMEAYLRGKLALRLGKVILNPHAWLKRTGYNIVREKHREHASQRSTEPELLEFLAEASQRRWLQPEVISDRLDRLMVALQTFHQSDPEAAELMELRIVEGLSWEQVRQHLILQGRTDVPDVEALRQRGCRIKKRLRQLFHEVEANPSV